MIYYFVAMNPLNTGWINWVTCQISTECNGIDLSANFPWRFSGLPSSFSLSFQFQQFSSTKLWSSSVRIKSVLQLNLEKRTKWSIQMWRSALQIILTQTCWKVSHNCIRTTLNGKFSHGNSPNWDCQIKSKTQWENHSS